MKIVLLKDFYKEKIFIPNQDVILDECEYQLNEADAFVPRFSLKNTEIFPDIPVNEPIKYSDAIATKAIKYGMIFLVNYKGEKDKSITGSERVTYFMVLGKSAKLKPLLRVYHLKGWSVSQNNNIEKTWRMFRTDRILSMTFTGAFFRLAPEGYNKDDKGMVGGIIASADFNNIRKNQEQLVNSLKIQDSDDVSMSSVSNKPATIYVNDTNTEVDILNPLDNAYIAKISDLDNLRITFLKSIYKDIRICVLGALGKAGNIVNVRVMNSETSKSSKVLGTYKVLDSISGKDLKRIKKLKGDSMFKLYIFNKKDEK